MLWDLDFWVVIIKNSIQVYNLFVIKLQYEKLISLQTKLNNSYQKKITSKNNLKM
jgi:hypothetical protein